MKTTVSGGTLIHGANESGTEWYEWIPRMAQQYRLIRPDLPGHGRSAVPAGFEYSHANLARFVTEIMDRAGVQTAHIIGAKTEAPSLCTSPPVTPRGHVRWSSLALQPRASESRMRRRFPNAIDSAPAPRGKW
ncbi:MAG: alpha/beta fold hydrolase [Gemmatimonadota bacterium]